MERLEIFDTDEQGVLSFELREFLLLLPAEVHSKMWHLLEIEAYGANTLEGEARVRENKCGIKLSWQPLVEFADTIDQIINMKLICVECGQPEPLKFFIAKDYEKFMILEVLDSSFWTIDSDIDSVINVVKQSFRDVRNISSP